MYALSLKEEEIEWFIESLTRYAAYLSDHALRMEAQHLPTSEAAGRKLREVSKKAMANVEKLQAIRRNGESAP